MADPIAGGRQPLDAGGDREVVFCHQCGNDWYRDEHGLTCPGCQSDAVEIVSPNNDPRPAPPPRIPPEEIRGLQDHDPWLNHDSDPEEDDIEQFLGQGPGNAQYFSRAYTSPGFQQSGHRGNGADPSNIMSDFQRMVSGMMGPGLQQGPAGRSGPDNLFQSGRPDPNFWPQPQARVTTFGSGNFQGARWTFTTGTTGTRADNGVQAGGDLNNILASVFQSMASSPGQDARTRGQPVGPGIAELFASLLNPANAVSGDAVYTQEALDRILTGLMEQHPTSNAPPPASPDAIANLPKKKVDEKILGAEGEAECSVCMDSVVLGEEVVVLPCTHWFHETCAAAWLQEHNTCPICRKGISDADVATGPGQPPPLQGQQRPSHSSPPNVPGSQPRRQSLVQRLSGQERLNSIRNAAGLGPSSSTTGARAGPPELEERTRRRYQVVGDGPSADGGEVIPPQMPGSWVTPPPGFFRRASTRLSQGDRRTSESGEGNSGSPTGVRGWLQRLGSNNEAGGGSGSGSGR